MVCTTPESQEESTHQTWDSYYKQYRLYAPDTFFSNRSEGKVTVTYKKRVTLHHSKMHPHTKFGIPISNNIRDMHEIPISKNIGEMHRLNAVSRNKVRGQVQDLSEPIMVRNTLSSQDASSKIVSEYDQEIPQSQTADNPVAPQGRAAQPSRDTRKTN